MSEPKLVLPPGTSVSQQFTSVTIHFFTEQEADDFITWLKWVDKQPTGKQLVVNSIKPNKQ